LRQVEFELRCRPETGEIEFEKGLKRIHDQDRDICRRAVEQVIAEGSPFSHHSRIFNRSNQTRWFASRGKLSQSPSGERRVIGTLHDITELKQAEAILQSANVELEARVAERTRQLVTAFEDLSTEMSRRRSLEAELTEISEREQSRLGQDLHDGLGQELTGIALLCITHAQLLARENHPSADRAAELADAIASTIEVARNLAKGFYPVELQRYGLITAIKDLLLQARKRSTITYELCLPPRFQRLPENVEIHLYRILQECLTNAAKHGGASRIRISLETDHEGCILAVEDNGCGFDTSIPRSGMGLHLIDYRSRIIGAEARIQSTLGKGCIIQCVVPASSSKRAAESHGTTPP
jgi:signal transduction histidine kinase